MPIGNLLKRFRSPEPDDYMEIESDQTGIVNNQVPVRVENLSDASDVERIQERLRSGTVLVVKIRDLKNKDMAELKRSVAKIKRTCAALDGDIVGVGQDWLLVTPKTARIHRE
jgi:SepF-like predicted cell division protein (DUF552 family)